MSATAEGEGKGKGTVAGQPIVSESRVRPPEDVVAQESYRLTGLD